ncbi:MAG TPA: DUF4835 family protein [Bacteroidota bacterium]|nr:DUF4835 family protein [Bacteroidota bacterium]
MHSLKKPALSILLCLFFWTGRLSSQEIDCDVKITNKEALTAQAREALADFLPQVTQYINSYRWTREDLANLKIKCTIDISFQGSPRDNHYSVQAFIGSQRPIFRLDRNTAVVRILDDSWEFDYVRSQPFIHNEGRYDPLLSVLDFYMYLILGYDFETYKAGDGTPYFQKALDIANLSRAGVGWDNPSPAVYSRGQLIDELMNVKFRDFRNALYRYHFRGLDLLYKDEARARKNIFAALDKIGKLQEKINVRSLVIRTFFDSKYQEIAEIFLKDPDREVFARLSKIDPAHQTKYEEASQRPR